MSEEKELESWLNKVRPSGSLKQGDIIEDGSYLNPQPGVASGDQFIVVASYPVPISHQGALVDVLALPKNDRDMVLLLSHHYKVVGNVFAECAQ